jgi:hypothetical protein
LEEIYLTGQPTKGITVRRTRGYEMLDPSDRGAFFEIVVGLLRAISAGDVRTGYVWAGLPNNLIHGVLTPPYTLTKTPSDASQTDNVKVDDSQMEIDNMDGSIMEADVRGEKIGEGKSGVEGIVEQLEGVDVFGGERGRSSRTLRRKTSRSSSKSPRKMSPRKMSPRKMSPRKSSPEKPSRH